LRSFNRNKQLDMKPDNFPPTSAQVRHMWILMIALASSIPSPAADKDWTMAGDSTWHQAAHWNPSGIPASADNAAVGNGGKAIIGTGATATARDFFVGRRFSGAVVANSSFELQANATFTTQSGGIGYSSGGSATIAGTWNTTTLGIGQTTVAGTLNITAGGKIHASTSTGIFGLSTATVAGELQTGQMLLSRGYVNLTSGGKLITSNFVGIGTDHSSNSALTVGDGGLWTHGSGYLQVGNGGTGRIRLQGSGSATIHGGQGTVRLGVNASDTGVLQFGEDGPAGSLSAASIHTGAGWGSVYLKHTGNFSLGIPITGNTHLIKEGSGTTTITGANSFTGQTYINAGRLVLGSATALGSDQRYLSMSAAGILDLNGYSLKTPFLYSDSYSNVIESGVSGSVSLTLDSQSSSSFRGQIRNGSGVVKFIKKGPSSFTLENNNPYTGGTDIEAGTLRVAANGALGTGPVKLAGGVLQLLPGVMISNPLTYESGAFKRDLTAQTPLSGVVNIAITVSGTETSAALLDGTLSASASIESGFSVSSPASNDSVRISAVLELSGLPVTDAETGETDLFVLQLRHEDVIDSSVLSWFDPATGTWKNAVAGNHTGTPVFVGDRPYNPLTDFHPGFYGVDTANQTVWAVLNHNSSFAAANLTTIQTPRQQFEQTVAISSLDGDDALPGAIPFNDGVSNLLKYAFNMNLAGPDSSTMTPGKGNSGLPASMLVESEGGTVLRIEYVRRKNSGLGYEPRVSSDLDAFEPFTGTSTVTDLDDTWERVVVDQPCDPQSMPRCFMRVEVTLPPG
jgi:autotransporter-associated beta strand protein